MTRGSSSVLDIFLLSVFHLDEIAVIVLDPDERIDLDVRDRRACHVVVKRHPAVHTDDESRFDHSENLHVVDPVHHEPAARVADDLKRSVATVAEITELDDPSRTAEAVLKDLLRPHSRRCAAGRIRGPDADIEIDQVNLPGATRDLARRVVVRVSENIVTEAEQVALNIVYLEVDDRLLHRHLTSVEIRPWKFRHDLVRFGADVALAVVDSPLKFVFEILFEHTQGGLQELLRIVN